jgi:hypothetical protein
MSDDAAPAAGSAPVGSGEGDFSDADASAHHCHDASCGHSHAGAGQHSPEVWADNVDDEDVVTMGAPPPFLAAVQGQAAATAALPFVVSVSPVRCHSVIGLPPMAEGWEFNVVIRGPDDSHYKGGE